MLYKDSCNFALAQLNHDVRYCEKVGGGKGSEYERCKRNLWAEIPESLITYSYIQYIP